MASHFDQENQLPSTQAASTRFGLRKDGQPKSGLSIVNSNAANTKKASQLQGKKVMIQSSHELSFSNSY